MSRLAGQTVMLTGAAGGFGRAAAVRFAEEGADLALCDRDEAALAALADALATPVFARAFDIADEKSIHSFVSEAEAALSPLTGAVNNAGIGQSLTALHETETALFDQVMSVNARSVFLCMKHQLPGMIARRAGAIVNVASAAGLIGAGHMAAYAASKHAVVGMTKAAADEVARHNVRVNALCPSFAPTPLFNEIADDLGARRGEDRHASYARVTARVPMRRVAEVAEVVEAMLFLLDPANSFMTGQSLSVDGGLSAV